MTSEDINHQLIIIIIETELFSLPGVDASHVYVRALALGYFYSHITTGTFRKALTESLDSCAEINCTPLAAYLNLAEFGRRCRKAMLGVWALLYLTHGATTHKS